MRRAHAGGWVAGWNMPGCLPDTGGELPVFGSAAEGLAYLRDELQGVIDGAWDGEDLSGWFEAKASVVCDIGEGERSGRWAASYSYDAPDGLVYWVEWVAE